MDHSYSISDSSRQIAPQRPISPVIALTVTAHGAAFRYSKAPESIKYARAGPRHTGERQGIENINCGMLRDLPLYVPEIAALADLLTKQAPFGFAKAPARAPDASYGSAACSRLEDKHHVQGDAVLDDGPAFHLAAPIVHLYAGDAPQCPGSSFESHLHCVVKTLGGSCYYLGLPRDSSIY